MRQKAFDRMIRVAARLKERGYDFIVQILGEGEDRAMLENLITKLELSNNVRLLGFVKPPYSIMVKADLFVSTSIMEGYPLNICEALCLGLPIVATRCCGNTELVDEVGILTEHDDDSILEGIVKMIEDATLRRTASQRALEKSAEFEFNKIMSEVYNLI